MFNRLEKLLNFIGVSLLFILMLFTFVDVFGRNVLNRPLFGAVELSEITLAVMIFALLPSVTRRTEHITVHLIGGAVGRLMDAVGFVLTGLLGAGFFGVMAWRMWIVAEQALSYDDTTPVLGIPIGYVIHAIAVFGAINGVVFFFNMVRPLFSRLPVEVAKKGCAVEG